MMDTMINEEGLSFKDVEEYFFKYICEQGRKMTCEFLEKYDRYLMETRDRAAYRHKGYRQTTIKTVYGEVEYRRSVYEVKRDDGTHEYVFLLDEQLHIKGVGLISQNLAEQLVSGITEMSYRNCADKISHTTGQSVSAMGVWNVIQGLGEAVCEDERQLVRDHKAGRIQGEKAVPVLFEEADGIYVNLQRERQKKGEIKVGIAYDGWKKSGKDRYALDGKVVVAGFSNAKDFHDYREAAIAEKYDTDEIILRIMNADGAEWIKNVHEADTLFQLDPFHRNKAIKECIPYPEAIRAMHEYLGEKDINGLFEYLDSYRNSLCDDVEIEEADRLITYFKNNRNGLIPYNERGIYIPESSSGLEYRGMGTMENHVWSIVARRMKHNHSSWTIKGGNNLVKILAKKCCGRLGEVAGKLKRPVFERKCAECLFKEVMSAAKVKEREGHGYEYPVRGSIVNLGGPVHGAGYLMPALAGYRQ